MGLRAKYALKKKRALNLKAMQQKLSKLKWRVEKAKALQNKPSLRDPVNNTKWSNTCVIGTLEGEEKIG